MKLIKSLQDLFLNDKLLYENTKLSFLCNIESFVAAFFNVYSQTTEAAMTSQLVFKRNHAFDLSSFEAS